VVFFILKPCTEECDSNTQVCNKYCVCFPVKETCTREFEGQVTGHWNFVPLTKSFEVLD
jgi:hypothetical protein